MAEIARVRMCVCRYVCVYDYRDLLRAPQCTQRGGRGQMAGRDESGSCQAALVTPITHRLCAGRQQVTVPLTST